MARRSFQDELDSARIARLSETMAEVNRKLDLLIGEELRSKLSSAEEQAYLYGQMRLDLPRTPTHMPVCGCVGGVCHNVACPHKVQVTS